MKSLYLLGPLLMIAACAPQASAPVYTTPPPPAPVAAAPPPTPMRSPPTRMSFDGMYVGSMTIASSGLSSGDLNRTGCVSRRIARMEVHGGWASIRYRDWKRHKLHYRGQVDPTGAITASHRNSDGSTSILEAQINGNELTGTMRRGPCEYSVALARR
jgi:hypothetical protein